MKLSLRIRSFRGVRTWIAVRGDSVRVVGPVREWPLLEIVEAVGMGISA